MKSLGQAGEIEPETEGILTEYGVDFSDFSNNVLQCLPQNLPWTIPQEELGKRRDLRSVKIMRLLFIKSFSFLLTSFLLGGGFTSSRYPVLHVLYVGFVLMVKKLNSLQILRLV